MCATKEINSTMVEFWHRISNTFPLRANDSTDSQSWHRTRTPKATWKVPQDYVFRIASFKSQRGPLLHALLKHPRTHKPPLNQFQFQTAKWKPERHSELIQFRRRWEKVQIQFTPAWLALLFLRSLWQYGSEMKLPMHLPNPFGVIPLLARGFTTQ